MNPDSIEAMVRDVLGKMNDAQSSGNTNQSAPSSNSNTSNVTVADYPLTNKHPEWVKTASGKTLDDITLANVLNDNVTSNDLRITPEILRIQADVARSAGRPRLATNFERAAELTFVPDERVLEIYTALRPYRSSKAELMAIGDELETKYKAVVCANFLREAATLYEQRKKLKGDN